MTGITVLQKIQGGKETVKGTAVAATFPWRGTGVLKDEREIKRPTEHVGIVVETDRSYVAGLSSTITFDEVEATFEQLPYIFESAIKSVSGVQDGAGTGYIYTYPMPVAGTPNAVKTYTIEGGDDSQAEEVEYCFVEEFTLKGTPNEALMVGASWRGRQNVLTTYTPAIAIPDVEEILWNKVKVYIDAGGGTIGTTLIQDTILEWSLSFKTGWVARFTGEGQLYFARHTWTRPEVTFDLKMEHNSIAVAEVAAWRAQTVRLLRFEILGDALGTSGVEDNKRFTFDVAGKWDVLDPLGDDDGNSVKTGKFKAGYNATDALYASAEIVNELAALT